MFSDDKREEVLTGLRKMYSALAEKADRKLEAVARNGLAVDLDALEETQGEMGRIVHQIQLLGESV